MDKLTIETPKHKMSSSKKLTCQGTLRQVFIRVCGLKLQSVMWYFRPSFVNYCPSTLLLVHLPPPTPLPCVIVQYVQT
jgi:hypothetical protein